MNRMRVFSDDDVRARLDSVEVIAAIEKAFSRCRDTYTPLRSQVDVPNKGVLLLMPCSNVNGLGVKLITVFPDAAERLQASYVLLDPETGEFRALIAANYLTDLRTAATSAIATKYMARPDVATLGIFGTGRQARAHMQVLPLVRQFRKILVCGSNAARSREFAAESSRTTGLPVLPADAHHCAAESDVICTCTTSSVPLFDGHWLRPGTHLNLIGAFQPHTREVDTATVVRARVVVDTYASALAEAGDLLIPIREQAITREHIVADLHELVTRKVPGQLSTEEITVFKSVGCALEDLVTANLLWSKVQEHASP